MPNKSHALFLAPVALLFATGATDCDAFTTVTVPSSDATAPELYDAVWRESEYEVIENHDQSLTYHLAPGDIIVALGSGLDSGGVKKIWMTRETLKTCCTPFNVCTTSSTTSTTLTDTQPGVVGDVVSEGMWLGQSVELPPLNQLCSPGLLPTGYKFRWRTSAENYHGKKRTGPLRTVQWP